MFLRRVELIEFVPTLQFSKQQFYLPATPIDCRYITRENLFSREVRDVEVVVVGVLDAEFFFKLR